jgi:plasmid stabilization system protein ParE
MKVKITKPVRQRLTEIDEYYKAKGNTTKGRKLRKKIVQKAKLLRDNPHLGKEEKYLEDLGLGHRSLVIDKLYKLIYRIAKPIIYIRLVQPEPQMAASGKFYLALRLPASEADEQAG